MDAKARPDDRPWSRQMKLSRRSVVLAGLGIGGAGAMAAAIASSVHRKTNPSQLVSDLREMLMFGFAGSTVESPSARVLADHIAAGRVGSVIFVSENVGNRAEVVALIRLFTSNAPSPIFVAIDHEGGAVQRLRDRHGFTMLPAAHEVATTRSPLEAKRLYARAANELSELGFNVNLGPVLDLHDPANPAVGKWGRSYSTKPKKIVAYAKAFIDAFSEAGIVCALKHFPGQGLATEDSHDELPDITANWSERDVEPYVRLIRSGRARLIMGGHVLLRSLETDAVPTTLSRAVTHDLLRTKLGFSGVMMTDELGMGAVSALAERRHATIGAIASGNDLLMLRNVRPFDPGLCEKIPTWVQEAIASGTLNAADVAASANRIRRLRRDFSMPLV